MRKERVVERLLDRILEEDGIDLIDVTVLGENMFGLNHGVFASSRSVLDDLGRTVSTGTRPPRLRTPTLQRMPDRVSTKYWAYPP